MLTTAALCLALNIYHEARDQPDTGQYAVAQVMLNRVGHDPDKLCDELNRPYQWSWMNTLTMAPSPEVRSARAARLYPREKTAWAKSKRIALKAIAGTLPDVVGDATHYLNPDKVVRLPRWARVFPQVARIGDHVFYRET